MKYIVLWHGEGILQFSGYAIKNASKYEGEGEMFVFDDEVTPIPLGLRLLEQSGRVEIKEVKGRRGSPQVSTAKKEDTKKEDTKKEDAKKEDTKKEDTKKEDTKKEDTKKEDTEEPEVKPRRGRKKKED